MKTSIFVTLFLSLNSLFGYSQSFIFNPTSNYEATVVLNTYTNHKVYMQNQTGEELTLAWELLYNDIPTVWESVLCDYGGCYVGVPDSGTMLTISDTIQGYLRLTINPFDHIGSGTAIFKVYDSKHPFDADTVSFTIHSEGITAVAEKARCNDFIIYPNPASDLVYYQWKKWMHDQDIVISDVHGKQLVNQPAEENGFVDISNLPQGIYLAIISNSAGLSKTSKLIIR